MPHIAVRNIVGDDSGGRVWLLSDDAGMDMYDPATGTFTLYAHHPKDTHSLGGNQICDLFEDRTGVL